MGKVDLTYHEELIPEIPDRQANYLKVYRSPNGEVTIRFRSLKIVLHNDMEIAEWRDGFREALEQYNKITPFKNDL